MVAEREEEQKSYQRALRVIGRYLDSEPAYNLSIAEKADGFTVRSHPTPEPADERIKHFEWNRLATEDRFYSAAGRGWGPKRRPTETPWALSCRHEQALRKLGSLLDAEGASGLSVDEMDDGLDVSFALPGQNKSGAGEKQQKVYRSEDLCG